MRIRVLMGLLLSMAISTVQAQTPTATVVGTVLDPAGAAVPGAKIEVRDQGTNEVHPAVTDEKGQFTVPHLNPGVYEVIVAKEGFQILEEKGLELQLDQQARMEYHLRLGSQSEKVEVTASVPLINTEDGSKGDVMVAQEMVEMPLDGRSFSDLAYLMPTVVPSVAVSGGGFQSNFATNGQRGDNVNFVIDGFNNRNPRDGSPQASPNLDAMQEFKMESSGYSAESGRTAGGLMTMVVKSGTNLFHGTLFEYLRNNDLDARNFFATVKPELRRNQFGGLISGPVDIPKLYKGKNRTFFLFSWESSRQVVGTPTYYVVATPAERQGNFSGVGLIKDPLATGACTATNAAACFPNNQIPVSRMNPTSLLIQPYYPQSNISGLNNYYNAMPVPTDWNSPLVKVDEVLSTRDSLSFTYSKRYNTGTTTQNLPDYGQHDSNQQTLAGLSFTHTFTPAIINEARFSVSRSVEQDYGVSQGTNYNQMFGMSGGPTDPNLIGFPQITITGMNTIGPVQQMPLRFWVTNYDTSDTVTWVKGQHLIKFGGQWLHSDFFRVYDTNARGTYAFTGSWTGQPYADFLLGYLNNDSILYGTVKSYLVSTNYSTFFQDNWKITSRLTLNLGLRYELPKPLYDKEGRLASYIPSLNKLVVSSAAGIPPGAGFTNASTEETAQQAGIPSALQDTDFKKIAPRFGFAWRPFGGNQTVIRGGYGIYYGTWEFNDILNNLAGNFPFVINETNSKPSSNPLALTISNPFPNPPSLVENDVSVYGIQLKAPNPYSQSWNLTVERDLGHNSAIEMGYTGTKGTNLSHMSNIDQDIRAPGRTPDLYVPIPPWSTLNYIGFNLNSIYNAGIFTFRRRLVNNFFYRASYTYAKSIDQGSIFQGQAVQDPYNMRLERGRSDFDIGHTVTMAFSWEAPHGLNRFLRRWQLAGTGVARTGLPFTPTISGANLDAGGASRPNRILKGTLPSPSVREWYNLAAFPTVPAGQLLYGDSGRNILDGPGLLQFNLSLCRNFAIREKSTLQIRWDAFNFLNRVNLGQPVVTVNTVNAATITSTAGTATNASNFGNSRDMQVALRLTF